MTMRCFVRYLMYCRASLNEFKATSVLTPSFFSKTLKHGVSSSYASSSLN